MLAIAYAKSISDHYRLSYEPSAAIGAAVKGGVAIELRSKWKWWLIGLALYGLALMSSTGWDRLFEFAPIIVLRRVVVTFAPIRMALFIMGAICWLAAAVLALREYVSRQADDSAPVDGAGTRAGRRAVAVISAIVLVSSFPPSFVSLLAVNTYRVIEPPSAGGCLIVVEVWHGAASSGGHIYTAPRGGVRLVKTQAHWFADDNPGYDPVRDGSVELKWSGDTAHLVMDSGSSGHAENFDENVDCG